MPRRQYAGPRYLIGGYVIGTAVGCALSLLEIAVGDYLSFDAHTIAIILGALATGLAMFLMVVTDTEHAPAAAVALGFVLNDWDLLTVLVLLIGISAIALIKELIKPRLIDLL
jgi:CBS-domain-containing membrane protein